MSDAPAKPDYRDTVFLPRTDFPMKAGLPQKEPAILAKWQAGDLYGQVRRARENRDKFILHDGPPYANGDIHIGHALNHILKDMVVRTQTLLGRDAPYVPGWDCHGLPIEWKVEEQYRKKKLNKDEVPVKEFRAECRAYAQHWVEVQREQLKRLGIGGDWDKPYLTMDYAAEATIVAELMKFAETGQIYRGAKPVMWSPVEKTALAEAEIEYEEITSTQIDVGFEIVEAPNCRPLQELIDKSMGRDIRAVVWTTTPWTIPVNQAVAFNPAIEYALLAISRRIRPEDLYEGHGPRPMSWPAGYIVVAANLVQELAARAAKEPANAVSAHPPLAVFKGADLVGAIARHPMHLLGGFFAKPRPFLPGEFVTTDSGTGLVHMSPDHGEDDFELCKAHDIDPVFAVEADGKYREDWLWLGGQGSVINNKFNAPDGPICSDLRNAGALLAASTDYKHSYPHSWRSKAKVIYRCTPQWFIAMDKPLTHIDPKSRAVARWENEGGAVRNGPSPLEGEGGAASAAEGEGLPQPSHPLTPLASGESPSPSRGEGLSLRQAAMRAIADTRFVPDKGRNRIGSMVADRPDWVISRQRAWGVPIALFVDKKTQQPLVDAKVNGRIISAVREQGVDAWDEAAAAYFLGEGRYADDYEMVTDILDVWFDSGCTHVFTLESGHWPEQRWPADLYLEGSDQHRGWFQSSLLESCGTRGRAPFDAVFTHGFTMDSKGMKMSKSLGNTIDPLKVMETNGADIIRLWALSVDTSEDHRIGDEILKGVADQYRKLRNTLRYLLGALDGFGEAERVSDVAAMPELERYMLHLTAELDHKLRQAVGDFDFNSYTRLLSDFANNDLSAFYFDIRKDSLYCDAADDPKRMAYRTVLDTLFHALVRWLAPVLVFTTEEVWATRFPAEGSVHLLEWPDLPFIPEGSDKDWAKLRELRTQVTEAIEPLRRDKVIGSSLEAEVTVPSDADPDFLAELFIVSAVKPGDKIAVTKTDKHKCGRCWRLLPEVKEDGGLCDRCAKVVA